MTIDDEIRAGRLSRRSFCFLGLGVLASGALDPWGMGAPFGASVPYRGQDGVHLFIGSDPYVQVVEDVTLRAMRRELERRDTAELPPVFVALAGTWG